MHLPRNIHQNYIQQQEAVATINRQGSLYALVMTNTVLSMNISTTPLVLSTIMNMINMQHFLGLVYLQTKFLQDPPNCSL